MVDVFFLFCLCGMDAGNRVHRKDKIELSELEAVTHGSNWNQFLDENGDQHPWVGMCDRHYITMRSLSGVGHADYDAPGQSLPSGTLGMYANASLIPMEDASTMHAWSSDSHNLFKTGLV